jgi:hypothetical protein
MVSLIRCTFSTATDKRPVVFHNLSFLCPSQIVCPAAKSQCLVLAHIHEVSCFNTESSTKKKGQWQNRPGPHKFLCFGNPAIPEGPLAFRRKITRGWALSASISVSIAPSKLQLEYQEESQDEVG